MRQLGECAVRKLPEIGLEVGRGGTLLDRLPEHHVGGLRAAGRRRGQYSHPARAAAGQGEDEVAAVEVLVAQLAIARRLKGPGQVGHAVGHMEAELARGDVAVRVGVRPFLAPERADKESAEGAVVGDRLLGVARGQELAHRQGGGPGDGRRRQGALAVEDGAGEARIEDRIDVLGFGQAHVFAEAADGQGLELERRAGVGPGRVGGDQESLAALGVAVAGVPDEQARRGVRPLDNEELPQCAVEIGGLEVGAQGHVEALGVQLLGHQAVVLDGVRQPRPAARVGVDADDQGVAGAIELDLADDRRVPGRALLDLDGQAAAFGGAGGRRRQG